MTSKHRLRRPRGVLPEGAGAVICQGCGARACADGKGSPIVLRCEPDCPVRKQWEAERKTASLDGGDDD